MRLIVKYLHRSYKCEMEKYSEFLKENYDVMLDIINCMRVGVWITDGQGIVLMVNDISEKRGGVKKEELLGKSMEELVDWGYITESSALVAKSNNKEETIVEHGVWGEGLVTSVPIYHEGKMELIVCVERDIKEIADLKEALQKQKETTEEIRNKLVSMNMGAEKSGGEIVANSYKMLRMKEEIKEVGRLDTTVIILGESGTGKELVADMLYNNSMRFDMPFVKVNCAAIPESLIESELFGYEAGAFTGADSRGKFGMFEQADGGTIFLDEIGELPLLMQSKLLRVLESGEIRRVGGSETKKIDVRIIAATNRELKKAVEGGTFREDLYYRLMIVPLIIPPLRERREDIIPIATMFLEKFNSKYNKNKVITEGAAKELMRYTWPGNVRELRNMIERLTISGEDSRITAFQIRYCINDVQDKPKGLTSYSMGEMTLAEIIYNYEKQIILDYMDNYDTMTAAAKSLGIDKSTLSRKLKKYQEEGEIVKI